MRSRRNKENSHVVKKSDLVVIAEQLGHTDTSMTEKHYAHVAPSYVADTTRAHLLYDRLPKAREFPQLG